jgi:hypothetical protein
MVDLMVSYSNNKSSESTLGTGMDNHDPVFLLRNEKKEVF